MSNIIALPATKATKKIKPPLKRREIIEAMVVREYRKQLEAYEERQLKADTAEKEFRAAALEAAKLIAITTDTASVEHTVWRDWSNGDKAKYTVSARVKLEIGDEKVHRLLIKWRKLADEVKFPPDEKNIRRKIKYAMASAQPAATPIDPTARINAMLNDPATVKALDASLAAIFTPGPKRLTA